MHRTMGWLTPFGLLSTLLAGGCDPAAASGPSVVINEFTSANDDDIELYNPTDAPVDLSGWILTDDAFVIATYDPAVDEEKYVFPAGTTLPAGGYLVLKKGEDAGEHPFGVSSDGETLTLIDASGAVVDQVTFQKDQAVTSFCRVPDGGDAWQRCAATFGAANQAE